MQRAGIVIIGDEILAGKVEDRNTPYLARRLRELGVDLGRVAVVGDEPAEIADEVRRQSAAYDLVFTSGGVGPTHDDRTMEALALAFGRPLVEHPELVAIVRERYGDPPPEGALRMARVPEGADLWWDGAIRYPLVVVGNVHVLPGVPSILQLKFEASAFRFRGRPVRCLRLRTLRTEVEIAGLLADAQRRWSTTRIGSYPQFDATPHHVVVTVEGRDEAAVDACAGWLREALPAELLTG